MGRRRVRFTAAPGTICKSNVGPDAREVVLDFGADGVLEFDEDDQEPVGVAREFAAHPRHPEITEALVKPEPKEPKK